MAELPVGTVTFLFTDIESSTRLLEQLGPERYGQLLSAQRVILRAAFEAYSGTEIDTQGDAFFVSFPRASDAVAAVVQALRALKEHEWPGDVDVLVRMGLHTGEPWLIEEGYVGMDVHRAARIAHAGHGGQVLLSETTTALVLDDLPGGVEILDLGRHLLKDMRRPEHIRQLMIQDMPLEFPPLKSLERLPPAELRSPRQVGECPYRGLAAFREGDAQFFYGRETFTKRLETAVRTKPLVAVIVGSSGSGKSSAVFAGLLPRLRGAGGWQVAIIRPGDQPFYALGSALLPLLAPELSKTDQLVEIQKLSERLTSGEINLYRVVEQILENREQNEQILLVIDQFEELYTLCPDMDTRQHFINELLATEKASSERRPSPIVTLLTMRADFMGQALTHRPFADALQEVSLIMGPMTRQELRDAIEKPGAQQGAAFEPGLVERILDDVGTEPGNLPLLEFALTLLWERESDGWLTHENYERIGCVEGALASYANEVYASLDENEKDTAHRVFTQLVRPGEGTEDTRRVASFAELGEENWRLVQHLADSRLVVTGRDAGNGEETVEVVHEALIQRWARLREWIEADRTFRTWQERLRAGLRGWEESGRDAGALLRGAPLITAEDWLNTRGGELTVAERDYIHSSVTFRESEQTRRDRRRRWTLVILSAGLMITITLTVFALLQRQSSQRQAAILLAGQAETELQNGYGDLAVLLALEALESYPYTTQAEHALGQAVTYNRSLGQFSGHGGAITSLVWTSDGSHIATTSTDNSVRIWDAGSGEQLRVIDLPVGITGNLMDMGLSVKWVPDSQRLLVMTGDRYMVGSQDYDILIYDAATGAQESAGEVANSAQPEQGDFAITWTHYPTSWGVDLAPRSRQLATLGGDNTAIIWDEDYDAMALVFAGHDNDVNSVNWAPDEDLLATASLDGTARIWDAGSGEQLHVLSGHEGNLYLALWSPDGGRLATGGEDGIVRIWNTENGELLASIITNAGYVWTLAWSPDGSQLATGQDDSSVRVWEAESGDLLMTLNGHTGIITDLAWSPDGAVLASADGNGSLRLWSTKVNPAWLPLPYRFVCEPNWSRDGRSLVVPSGDAWDGTEPPNVEIWDVEKGEPVVGDLNTHHDLYPMAAWLSPDSKNMIFRGLASFTDLSDVEDTHIVDVSTGEVVRTFSSGDENWIRHAAWSPDGSQVATAKINGEIFIWDFATGTLVTRLLHGDGVFIDEVEWSPDGSKFASAGEDTSTWVWDARSWEHLLTLKGHEPPAAIWSVSWSPDSRYLLTTSGYDEIGALDTTARIWDAESGEERLVLRGHTQAVIWGTWSPDGSRVATASSDDTTRVWDVATGAELLTLTTPNTFAGYAEWSPDGQNLVVGGFWAEAVGVWRVWQSKEELIDYAYECCVFRQLTETERQQSGLLPIGSPE